MKAVINGIEIEGTPQEILELVNLDASKIANTVETVAYKPKKEKQVRAAEVKSKPELSPIVQLKKEIREALNDIDAKKESDSDKLYFDGLDEFLTALYRYKPSNTSMGRESYIVQLLATGQPYTIKRLVREGRTDLTTVKQAITRAVSADCVVQATNVNPDSKGSSLVDKLTPNSKVKMLAIGTIEGARAARSKHENAHLKSVRIAKPKTLDTGSAPITKIIHPEDRKKTEQE